MNYRYQCRIRAIDLWLLSMYHTYHSMVGVCNLVFGVSMIALTLRFWDQAGDVMQAALLLLCLVIPVLQPVCVYLAARARAAAAPQGADLTFMEDGIHVEFNGRRELIRWAQVRRATKAPNMVILLIGAGSGYMLTNRVLGKDKKRFYEDVRAHVAAEEKRA